MRTASPLSSRERVLRALGHEDTDRVPIAMVCSGINEPARSELAEYLRREHGLDLQNYLDSFIDIRRVGPVYQGPKLSAGEDCWGVRRKAIGQGGGGEYEEIDYYPLATAAGIDDLVDYRWPQVEWFDYGTIPDQIERVDAEGGPYAIMALNCNIFESSWYMRGFEQMFMDLALEDDLAEVLLRKVADFFYEHARCTLEAADGRIHLIFTADDLGQQAGLLLSLPMWEKHIKPHHVRINELIHSYGAKVIYHTDGAIMEAVPGLIDMGIDVLQALQFDARDMDSRILKDNYGDHLCFEGGVSVQKTLPFGTSGEVKREVESHITTLARGGGYILGPSHAIQAGTPAENIYTMFETALNHRRY
jgi:uroporphyrinogen decarboxylase